MKKIFFLFFLLFLLGCTPQTIDGEEIATTCPPICSGGNLGVITEIDAPREEGNVYVGDRLTIAATLTDLGEANVEDGLVCITGLD